MRFKSKYIVFLLVVCILFSAAAVSASDATYMDVNADDSNEKLELTNYNSNAANHAYTVYRASDMKVICHSNVINLKALIDLFKLNMTNGHLKVYIDGTLVFDGDVDDDLSKVIIEIIEKLLGMHEITVEFTDKSGKTETLNETIIIE